MDKITTEKDIRIVFRVSIIIKLVFAVLQILSGIILFILSQNIITKILLFITQEELTEDSKDYIATHILQFGTHLALSTKIIIVIYLLAHGIIKLYLLYGLWKDKIYAYPLSAVVFSLFLAYQLYRYQFSHSIWLLILSLFDIVYIWLILHEYHIIKKKK